MTPRRKKPDKRNWENCPRDGTKLRRGVCKQCGYSLPEWWESEPAPRTGADGRVIPRLYEEAE
jgi:hypothetical protein